MTIKSILFLSFLLIFTVEGYCRKYQQFYGKSDLVMAADSNMGNIGLNSVLARQQRKRIRVGRFIKPMGVVTFFLVFLSVFTGLFRRRLGRYAFKWHKIVGVSALASAIIHGSMVIIVS